MTRKLDVQRVVREVFEIYRDQAAVLLPAAAIIFVFTVLIRSFLLSGGLVGGIVVLAVHTIAITFYSGMVVNLVRDVQDGRRDSSVADLFRAVLPVFLALLVVGLLIGVAVSLGLFLLILPGLLLLTIWAVVAPVVMLERPSVVQSFVRSWTLVRPNFWRVFGAVVIFFLIAFVVSFLLQRIGAAAGDGGLLIGSFIGSVLTAPLYGLLAAVLYFHLHTAKEGAAPPGTPGATPAPAGPGTTEPTREHSVGPGAPATTPETEREGAPRPQSPPPGPQSPPAGPQSPSGPERP